MPGLTDEQLIELRGRIIAQLSQMFGKEVPFVLILEQEPPATDVVTNVKELDKVGLWVHDMGTYMMQVDPHVVKAS